MTAILASLVVLAFPALVILGGVKDLVSYRIPNAVSLGLLAAFVPAAGLALIQGAPLQALGLDLAVGAAAFALGLGFFALGWVGGGDAKLFAAAALWLGWPAALTYLAVTAVTGGALSIVLLTLRSAPLRPLVLAGPGWFARLGEPQEGVPYGVAIAVGALVAFPACALAGLIPHS